MRTIVLAGLVGLSAAAALAAASCSAVDADESVLAPDLGADASYTDAAVEPPVAPLGDVTIEPYSDGSCTGPGCCGNGVVDVGEVCDTGIKAGFPGSCGCATSCNPTCGTGDSCCPPGCNANTDTDCKPACGNGAVEQGEVCDTAIAKGMTGACPASQTDCPAASACASFTFSADATDAGADAGNAACQAACQPSFVATSCGGACCWLGCDSSTTASCGATATDDQAGCVDLARLAGTVVTSSLAGADTTDIGSLVNGAVGCDFYEIAATATTDPHHYVKIALPGTYPIARIHVVTVSSDSTTGDACGLAPGHALATASVAVLGDPSSFDPANPPNTTVLTNGSPGSPAVDWDITLPSPVQGNTVVLYDLTAVNQDPAIREVYVYPSATCATAAQ